MALFPQDPRQQLMLLIIILAGAAGALYFNFIHLPAETELVELNDRVETLETQNQLAEARIGNLQRLRDELSVAEQQLAVLERLVPEGSEVAEIYEAIASETQALNLRLLSVEPLAPVDADSSGTLARQVWSMIVEGEYHAIGRFLANVASFDRIVRPQVSQVVPTGTTAGGEQLVTATFDLETFVLRPDAVRTTRGSGGASPAPAEGLLGQ